jgi:N-glycosylase/DNA lyase
MEKRMYKLPDAIQKGYEVNKEAIRRRLEEFAAVPECDYFYELCFCICTPQSKAAHAWQVQKKLTELNFLEKPFDPVDILNDKQHYIRFHNQKAKRLLEIRKQWSEIKSVLDSNMKATEKRFWLFDNVKGMGLKESAHYLRNIGYRELGILDRHILKHLVSCNVYDEVPNISGKKRYLEVEEKFLEFAAYVNIPIDELDLLFWSYETGEILK